MPCCCCAGGPATGGVDVALVEAILAAEAYQGSALDVLQVGGALGLLL